MDRREFSALLPAMLAVPALLNAQAKPATVEAKPVAGGTEAKPAENLPQIKSGAYPAGPTYPQQKGRDSNRFVKGMLAAGNIRLESHVTYVEAGSAHEPINKHLHSEIWFMREGTIDLNINGVSHILNAGDMGICVAGDLHYLTNIGKGRASYLVVTVGPPE
jgi:mannose-6-phosphate isomerase-like protein (cupin superfamily)